MLFLWEVSMQIKNNVLYRFIILLCFLLIVSNPIYSSGGGSYGGQELRLSLQKNDYLRARQQVYHLAKLKMDVDLWKEVRNTINQNPQIGRDILLGWDNLSPLPLGAVDKQISIADKLFLEKKFYQSAEIYQKLLKFLTIPLI